MKTRGFTLVELLIVIGILIMILTLGLASFSSFNRKERVRQTALTLKSNLRLTQAKSISSQKPAAGCTSYLGIRMIFTASSYQWEHVCDPEGVLATADCTPPSITDCVILQNGLAFSPVPSSFTFMSRTNSVDISANNTLRLTNGTDSYSLVITPNGSVNDEGYE